MYHKKQGTVSIQLNPIKHPNIAPGGVVSFEATVDQDNYCMITRNLEYPNQIHMHICTPDACEIPARMLFGKTDAGQSLVKEICHKGTSSHYLKVLNLISSMEILEQC